MNIKKRIDSFHELDVYKNAYSAMLDVCKLILPKLPNTEINDLTDQLGRFAKAIPRLIAEGHAKRHQKRGFQKYIDDAMAESNETTVSLSQVRDIYGIETYACDRLIDVYDKISRQLYNLSISWTKFMERKNLKDVNTQPINY